MIPVKMTIRTRLDVKKVLRASMRANIESLAHAGAVIRLTARRSIRKRKGPSIAGQPPHTHTGALRNAILYAVEKTRGRVVIGPTFGGTGTSAMAHEFGGRYRKTMYPRRPFMGPALEKIKTRLPRIWAASIK